jgi:hypothetical protein
MDFSSIEDAVMRNSLTIRLDRGYMDSVIGHLKSTAADPQGCLRASGSRLLAMLRGMGYRADLEYRHEEGLEIPDSVWVYPKPKDAEEIYAQLRENGLEPQPGRKI